MEVEDKELWRYYGSLPVWRCFWLFFWHTKLHKTSGFITMPRPRHKCKQCRKWVSCNITWNAWADVSKKKCSFLEANFCFLSGILWFFLRNRETMERNRWLDYPVFNTEMSDIVCPYLRRDGISRTHLVSFLVILGAHGPCYCHTVLPTWLVSKLCLHVLIQDLLEKLHLKTILFVQAIWLNHQPLRFVLAFKPNIAAEKRPFSLGWKPTPNWSHLRREVVFVCVMCIHVFLVFQQPFSRPVFV